MDIAPVSPYRFVEQAEANSLKSLSDRLTRSREAGGEVSGEQAKLLEACRDFEALFIKQMLDAMRKTVGKTGLLDGGMAEDIFEDMLYDEYAKKMADTAGFGLAETLYRELSPRLAGQGPEASAGGATAAYARALG
jgi:flagellar protein FlgJ